MVTRAREAAAPRVALAADDPRTGAEVERVAAARGFVALKLGLEAAVDAPVGAIAYAPAEPPTTEVAARLAPLVQRAAENRRPVVLLAAFERARGRTAEERAAALAYLRAHGAIVLDDPDVWFEASVFAASYGPAPGPRVVVIAPPGGWLHLKATALALEEEARGGARMPVSEPDREAPPADVALVDANLGPIAPERAARALVVPVAPRAEQLPGDGKAILVGLRAAIASAAAMGRHGERLAQGLGVVPASELKKLRADRDRADRAIADGGGGERLGDHETKRLLAAYGVPVTRQGVAATPSAAVRIAATCGFPVEVKLWDPSAPSERDGGPLVTGVKNPPDVRRAFAAVASAAGREVGVPVIVRVTPPAGREVHVRVERLADVGWTVLADVPGAGRPLAAPAPLRRIDAEELASALESTRAGDPPPDRGALADLLLRASQAAVDREAELDALELGRVVVAPRGAGAVVVDARARLKRRRR